MKLTPEQIENMTRMAEASEFVGAPVLALLDHIRAVEAERDDWRTMAGRLAEILKGVELEWNDDAALADYDALVALEVKS